MGYKMVCPICGEPTGEESTEKFFKINKNGEDLYIDESTLQEYKSTVDSDVEIVDVPEGERVPGQLCRTCKERIDEMKKIVEDGGIYFTCKECGVCGAFHKEHPLTIQVRKEQSEEEMPGILFEKCEEHIQFTPAE